MSSYYDDASLMLLASGGAQKDGKVYSVKPTDGSGDFTFTRGSNLSATRVDASQLIEKGRENLALQSNQFDTTWANLLGGAVTSGQSGYDGSSDAWLLNGSGGFARLTQSVSLSGVFTISVYAKANTTNYLNINMLFNGVGQNVVFDLVNGVKTAQDITPVADKMTDVGNGWWRIELTLNGNLGSLGIAMSNDGTIGGWVNFTSGSFYIQDAQLEQGLVATPYIETGATTAQAGILENTPRFDYSGGATCPSLLLEPSRTNLINRSEYFGSYSKGGGAGFVVTDNYGTSPEGVQNACRIQYTSGNTYLLSNSPNITTGQVITMSIYAKGTAGEQFRLYSDGSGGASANTELTLTTDWKRYEVTSSAATANGVVTPHILVGYGSSNPATDFQVYGWQGELASYATSYIPTYGVSQTRAGEVCGGAGDSSTFNDSEGVLYAEIEAFANDGTNRVITISDGTTSNRVQIYFNYSNGITGGVPGQAAISFSGDFTQNTKVAFKYKANDFALWVNGIEVGTDIIGSAPTGLNVINFDNGASGSNFYGKTKELIVFPTALSDLDLAILTGATTYNTFAAMALALNYTVYE